MAKEGAGRGGARQLDEPRRLTGERGLVGNPASWEGLVSPGRWMQAWQVRVFQGWRGPATAPLGRSGVHGLASAARGWVNRGSVVGVFSPASQRLSVKLCHI